MGVKINRIKVKEAMFVQGYSVSELAKKVGVGSSYMSQVLNSKKQPSAKLAKSMSEVLGIEVTEMFNLSIK